MAAKDPDRERAFRAALVAEGALAVQTEEEYLAAWQLLVDSGLCWRPQGWFGRTAAGLIEAGIIRPARGAERKVVTAQGREEGKNQERTNGQEG